MRDASPSLNDAYRQMFESPDRSAAYSSHAVIGWVCVVWLRLLRSGHIGPFEFIDAPAFDHPPPIESPGWYPNPVDDQATRASTTVERYWDGDWTEQCRFRAGAGVWTHVSRSLHVAPTDAFLPNDPEEAPDTG